MLAALFTSMLKIIAATDLANENLKQGGQGV